MRVSEHFDNLCMLYIFLYRQIEGLKFTREKVTPRVHITILTSEEKKVVEEVKGTRARKIWKDVGVKFKVKSATMFIHDCPNDEKKLICCLTVTSSTIAAIREDMGFPATNEHLNLHITVSEKICHAALTAVS